MRRALVVDTNHGAIGKPATFYLRDAVGKNWVDCMIRTMNALRGRTHKYLVYNSF